MQWIDDYQLFLFDFDGLLVNTEEIHFEAYRRMCAEYGVCLPWNFTRYCNFAHVGATDVRDQLYIEFPQLLQRAPSWDVLYAEKRKIYEELLTEGSVELMPGVEKVLRALEGSDVKRCVVTHSPLHHIAMIREQQPVLNTIPNWVTRDDYSNPKPDSECYHLAIKKFSEKGDHIIGFEDSPRGWTALKGTQARAIVVCATDYPHLPDLLAKGAEHIPNFSLYFK